MYSKTVFVGRLTSDLALKKTQNERSFCSARLAVERSAKPRSAGKPEVDFHNIVFWGKTAEVAVEYLEKGRLLLVEGRLRNDHWRDKNGVMHREEVLDVTELQFLERKKKGDPLDAPEQEKTTAAPDGADSYDYEALMAHYNGNGDE